MSLAACFLAAPALAVEEPLPDFNSLKLAQDVLWAMFYGYDPILIIAHIRAESGALSLNAGDISRDVDDLFSTHAISSTGDFGRHQVNCAFWKARQKLWKAGDLHYTDFPQSAQINGCEELFNDYINRVAYYYILYKYRQFYGIRTRMYNIPVIFGHYNSGFLEPNDDYMKKISYFYSRYKRALMHMLR